MSIKILLAGLAALPLAAYAEGFDYTYVDAGYINSTANGAFNADGDGVGVGGAYAFSDKLHLLADYTNQNFSGGLDGTSFDLGVGGHWAIQDGLDFVTQVAWVNAKVDTPFGSADDNGFGINAGVRYRATGKVELQGGIDYVNLSSSNTALDLAGRYYLSDKFAVGAGLVFDNDNTGWSIGIRAEF